MDAQSHTTVAHYYRVQGYGAVPAHKLQGQLTSYKTFVQVFRDGLQLAGSSTGYWVVVVSL